MSTVYPVFLVGRHQWLQLGRKEEGLTAGCPHQKNVRFTIMDDLREFFWRSWIRNSNGRTSFPVGIGAWSGQVERSREEPSGAEWSRVETTERLAWGMRGLLYFRSDAMFQPAQKTRASRTNHNLNSLSVDEVLIWSLQLNSKCRSDTGSWKTRLGWRRYSTYDILEQEVDFEGSSLMKGTQVKLNFCQRIFTS